MTPTQIEDLLNSKTIVKQAYIESMKIINNINKS